MLELDRYRRFNLAPRQTRRQHRQGGSNLSLRQCSCGRSRFLAYQSLGKYFYRQRFLKDLVHKLYTKSSLLCGLQGCCSADYLRFSKDRIKLIYPQCRIHPNMRRLAGITLLNSQQTQLNPKVPITNIGIRKPGLRSLGKINKL